MTFFRDLSDLILGSQEVTSKVLANESFNIFQGSDPPGQKPQTVWVAALVALVALELRFSFFVTSIDVEHEKTGRDSGLAHSFSVSMQKTTTHFHVPFALA